MMERNVVGLETAKRLETLGFKTETVLYWTRTDVGAGWSDWRISEPVAFAGGIEYIIAPTAQEIADELVALRDPYCLATLNLQYVNVMSRWFGYGDEYSGSKPYPREGGAEAEETLAEVLAAIWIKLHTT